MQDVNTLERGDITTDGAMDAKARLIRNRQATVMLESSVLLQRIIRNSMDGAALDDIHADIKMVSEFLRRSAF